ncbi:thiol-disulfide oxidoreductase DCC family protein [Pseudomonas aeruginosa]|nr:DCC1-like thiol-disulfide oxidoreductase family protein [Pseudomonas aeruginosa]
MTAQKENSDSTPTSRPPFPPLRFRACAQSRTQGGPSCHCRRTSSPATRSCCTTSTAAFCTLWSGFLARRADHRLKLLAAQSAEGLAILDWFGLAPDHFDTWLFVDGAYACDDNDALLEVLRLLPGPWRHLRWLRLLPAWLRDECHEALRRNRWRWFGRQRPPLRRRSWRPRRA